MMTDKKRFQSIRRRLISWYRTHYRRLPWRATTDPYSIWVSEVMLQQTQVNTVLPYYDTFLERFPDQAALARADLQSVLKRWEGLGYYARARNMHRAAKQIVEMYGGVVPSDRKTLQALPGIGDYIASALLSIAFGQPYAVVDGNVKRVLARLFEIDTPVNLPLSYPIFLKAAQALLDTRCPGTFNQAMMELGAICCTPRQPQCRRCPVKAACCAYEGGTVVEYPKRIRKKPVPSYHMTVGVVYKAGRVLITRRKPEGFLGGLWEFPCGTIGKDESAESACVREIKDQLGLTIRVIEYLTRVKHAYTHFKVTMDVFQCRYVSGRVTLNGAEDFRWIRLKDIDAYPFPKGNHKFIPALREQKIRAQH